MERPLILTFVGMPGAGKSSCVDYMIQKYPTLPPVLYFGGITDDLHTQLEHLLQQIGF